MKLRWKELLSVILDIEIALNNQYLGYTGNDILPPIFKLNLMILGKLNFGLEGDVGTESCDLKKRAKYVHS